MSGLATRVHGIHPNCGPRSVHSRLAVLAWLMALTATAAALIGVPAQAQGGLARMRLVFSCKPTNDLFALLAERGGRWMRFDTPQEAVRYAPNGAGVLILTEGYPDDLINVNLELFDLAASKGLRVYIEFPKNVPGIHMEAPRQSQGERVVVSSGFFGDGLEPLRILTMHDCTYVAADAVNPDLVLARVAGFDTVVFGLPPLLSPLQAGAKTAPILVKSPLGQILVATTKLSQFITGRYAPIGAWRQVWEGILEWLSGAKVALPDWTPPVMPSFGPQDVLPATAGGEALRRGAQWYFNAKMLVHPTWQEKLEEVLTKPDRIGPQLESDVPVGDGKLGLVEGIVSKINYEGEQPVRYVLRNDCMGESAMALAFDNAVHGTATSSDAAGNLIDFIYATSELAKGPRSDPKSPSFGLVGWNTDAALGIYYGDDNARSLLGAIATAALLKIDRWDESVLRCLLANLRTTGSLGFRENAVVEDALQQAGWRHFFTCPTVSLAPHYQAYLWAAFLWAHKQTGYAPFLDRAKSAIKTTMESYPDKWRWTNGIQQERARMLLPLAWLVRIDDTQEHRQWLRRMADDLLAKQDACGAIPEELGAPEMGTIPPPQSNDDYGKSESPVIQQNGDPGCDLLYTTNFAFIGLHEAAAAAGDAVYADGEKKLADFLCRIQIKSETQPALDGGWYRAFDFKRWEYWGSSGDTGWGAWSIETGWTQGWITSVFALREMKTSLWDVTSASQIKKHLDALIPVMLDGAFEIPADEKASHLATGKPVTLTNPYTVPYSGGGAGALTNGWIGKPDPTHPAWQGFLGADLDAVVDLGGVVNIKHVQAQFLHAPQQGVFLPSSVEYAVVVEGNEYKPVAAVANDVPANTAGPMIKPFAADIPETPARYVRVHAKNVAAIPEGNPNAGKPALLFVDELLVQ